MHTTKGLPLITPSGENSTLPNKWGNMNSLNVFGFLQSYTLPSVIISIASAIVYILIDRFFGEKIRFTVKTYIPFATGIILNFFYDAIICGNGFNFSAEILSSGLLCGSLSTAIFAAAKRVARGETDKIDAVLLIIEGILRDYVSDSAINVTAKAVMDIISDVVKTDPKNFKVDEKSTEKIAKAIKDNSDKDISDGELYSAAKLIASAVENYKKT